MRPAVLGEWGKEGIEFCLGKADDVGGGFLSELLKVKLGSGTKCFDGGHRSKWGQGADDIGVGINRGGLEGVWVDKGNASVGKQGGVLGDWGM